MKDHDNVLFLAMSTLPSRGRFQKNCYFFDSPEGRIHFYGYSQLEPGTKLILYQLAQLGERIDRIVVIGSNATCNDPVPDLWKPAVPEALSPVDFYEKRILEYIKGTQDPAMPLKWDPSQHVYYSLDDESAPTDAILLEQTTSPSMKTLYRGVKTDGLFSVINPENPDDTLKETYFWDVANAILGHSKKVRLFMDTQGGLRDMVYDLNGIADLLHDQGVEIISRTAIPYSDEKLISRITNVNDHYRRFDLLTAAHVFKKYGWGEELSEFFSDERDIQLSRTIQKASEAIKTCDVEGFDAALLALGGQIRDRESQDGAKEKTRLDLILNDIKADYGKLLDPDQEAVGRYVLQIRWCLKKKFIQQALTILEAKMPIEYVRSGLCFYCNDLSQKQYAFETLAKSFEDSDKSRNPGLDINHFFITTHVKKHLQAFIQAGTVSDFLGKKETKDACIFTGVEKNKNVSARKLYEEVANHIRVYLMLRDLRNNFNHANSKWFASDFYVLYKQREKEIQEIEIREKEIREQEAIKKAAEEVVKDVTGDTSVQDTPKAVEPALSHGSEKPKAGPSSSATPTPNSQRDEIVTIRNYEFLIQRRLKTHDVPLQDIEAFLDAFEQLASFVNRAIPDTIIDLGAKSSSNYWPSKNKKKSSP